MKFQTRLLSLAIVATTALLLSGCSGHGESPEPAPEPEMLSASEAGGIYLDAVCPVNAAWDAADLELERLRLTLSRGEDDTRRFAAAMNEVATASAAAASALDPKKLDKEGHAWPQSASADIKAVRQSLTDDQKQATRVAKLTGSEVLNYSWQGADEVGAAASAARDALGLPADGQSACAQWQEQLEAEEAAAKKAEQSAGKSDTSDPQPGDTSGDKSGADQ